MAMTDNAMDGMSPLSSRTGLRRDTTTTAHQPGNVVVVVVTRLPTTRRPAVRGCVSAISLRQEAYALSISQDPRTVALPSSQFPPSP